MPPKKDEAAAGAAEGITGFTARETKLLAAAFVAASGPDKYDYELFATLTGNTAGSLKKLWPPVKRKAIEAHPSFGTFLGAAPAGGSGEAAGETKAKATPKAKANNAKKRKAASTEPDDEDGTKEPEAEAETGGKKKPGPKGRKKKDETAEAEAAEKKTVKKGGRKKVKTEPVEDDEEVAEEGNAEGGQEEV